MQPVKQTLISWGPPGLFLMALIDSAGIPMPLGVDLSLLTVATFAPAFSLISAAMATTGSLIGCLVLYSIARHGGQRYLDKQLQGTRAQRFRRWFQDYGLTTVFVPVVVPILPLPTKIFVISAGTLGVPITRFLLVVLAGRSLRYFGLAYLGSQLGVDSDAWLNTYGWYIAGAALALFAGVTVLVKISARRRGMKTASASS